MKRWTEEELMNAPLEDLVDLLDHADKQAIRDLMRQADERIKSFKETGMLNLQKEATNGL